MTRLYFVNNKAPLAFPGRDEGGFIPDPRLKGSLSVKKAIELCCFEPMPQRQAPHPDIDSWFAAGCSDDEISRTIFPFRAKGDKVLRRTRFFDLYQMYAAKKPLNQWLKIASSYKLDYIRTLNTLHYLCKLPQTEGIEKIVLAGDIDFLDERTNLLTNMLKAQDADDGWWMYAETKCLTGYRLSPWPGFDETKSTEELASGTNEEHRMYKTFGEWLDIATASVKGRPTQWMSLAQFIESGNWLTAGSSSEGYINIIFDGKKYKVKCRKNFVKDALTVDELLKITAVGKQTSTAFAKCELGKVRIAVCSDIGTYLLMAWYCFITGYPYKRWKWTTRNETGDEKLERMLKLLERLRYKYFGMAWDYKGFERQVSLKLQIDMLQNFDRAGRANVPAVMLSEWLYWKDK